MKKTVQDMILNLIFIAMGILIAIMIPSQVSGLNQKTEMGPDFFPFIAAGLMVAVNTIAFIVNYFKYRKETSNGSTERVKKADRKDQLRVVLVLIIIVLYILLMPVIGYVPSTLIVVNILLFVLGVRKWYQYLLVSGFSMVIFYVFKYVLYVMLP